MSHATYSLLHLVCGYYNENSPPLVAYFLGWLPLLQEVTNRGSTQILNTLEFKAEQSHALVICAQ